ncbi:glutathione peroxidase [Paracrocinitomix mangrovi]|uniref:glutathione peroxidase n=1 Tax=Paracrocinitomix mangrovi TaxID=2862509 RepID=UPI001C8DF7E7|nr:glutathione peroxidase [Paracrocinitomix mangrovi]UKN00352.1 glutathione peroxidase [Paracrocinitomix mangrovi]
MSDKFYEFEAQNMRNETVKMSDYQGKTVLVVNTATKCGLAPQFDGLEDLYQKYKDKDFVILGFPSNQFANQEPGNNDQIEQSCRINFGVTFPIFQKIKVNGDQTHPIFKYLKSELKDFWGPRIKWNFTKFLIGPDGKPVKRFSPRTSPAKIDQYLQQKNMI